VMELRKLLLEKKVLERKAFAHLAGPQKKAEQGAA